MQKRLNRIMWSNIHAKYSHWKYLSMLLCKHILKEIHFIICASKFWHNASKIISLKLAYFIVIYHGKDVGSGILWNAIREKWVSSSKKYWEFSLCPILKEEIFIINYIFIRTISILFASSLSSKWTLGKFL